SRLALALGALTWVWLQPRTARDCAPSDSACLRKVAEQLIAESLEVTTNPFISNEIQSAGRLLATEGAIDLAAQHDRLTAIGFGPHNIRSVFDTYFHGLFDPTYPFDIPAAIAAETGPEGSNLQDYLTAAFRLALADPDRRTRALTLWDQHFDAVADFGNPSGSTSHFVLSWLARHDPTLGAKYFRRATDAGAYVAGPGGWQVFFETAAWHCREGRLDQGRILLAGLGAKFPPQDYIDLHLPALLDCQGETDAVSAVDLALDQRALRVETVLRDHTDAQDFVVSQLQDLSKDLRNAFAAWLYQQDRGAEVPAIWSRYGAAEIARRYLPQQDWLPARLAESQSAPVPNASRFDVWGLTVEGRLHRVAAEGALGFALEYDDATTARIIEMEWPSPQAIEAARGLVQHSKGSPLVTAFVVGLERQLGCAPSDATLQTLLDDISTLKDPLDEARAIIELLRFTPPPATDTAAAAHGCIVE
ncbi:MAG: hypothetical protein HC783_09105, partial [Rhodobacteraceae bacterium]|nr:hypothetical protein [Paracoccaceae bacterium]